MTVKSDGSQKDKKPDEHTSGGEECSSEHVGYSYGGDAGALYDGDDRSDGDAGAL